MRRITTGGGMMAHRQPGLAQQEDMGEQHQAGERPESLRADAQLNRDRILEVARDALAVSGDASGSWDYPSRY
jgi:hypothetical protein